MDAMPGIELQTKHLQNCRVLTTREAMLELFPKGGVVTEVGVNKGEFSQSILDITQPEKFHIVDIWSSERYHSGVEQTVRDRFQAEIKSGQIEINKGMSTTVLPTFEDRYFDMVYIDSDLTYPTTAAELEISRTKMKKGGIIAGHDFDEGSFVSVVKYGVIEAVYEFCVKYDWELIYVTMESQIGSSFAIRKIGEG